MNQFINNTKKYLPGIKRFWAITKLQKISQIENTNSGFFFGAILSVYK